MGKLVIREKFPMKSWPLMDDFIKTTHGENHVLRNRALFEWCFLRNNNYEEANVIGAYHNDELVSLLGYIPSFFRFEEELIGGAWMAHWMTKEEYRFGIGALLMRKITEMFPVAAGQGASSMNEQIVKKMGFEFRERIPKVIFIFNPDVVGAHANFGYHVFREPQQRSPSIDGLKSPVLDQEFCPDWTNYPSLKYGTLRNADYINRRYINYPFFDYKVVKRGPPSAPSLSVSRLVDATTNSGSKAFKVGRILEFFFAETAAGIQIAQEHISDLLADLKHAGCDYVDFYSTSQTCIEFLVKNGFIHDPDGSLPSLLDPINLTRKYQNFELFIGRDLKQKYPNAHQAFYVTRADGDQDRPNRSFSLRAK